MLHVWHIFTEVGDIGGEFAPILINKVIIITDIFKWIEKCTSLQLWVLGAVSEHTDVYRAYAQLTMPEPF